MNRSNIKIAERLRGLCVGEYANFPIENVDSVTSGVSRFNLKNTRTGLKLETKTDKENGTVIVTRTK